MESCSEISSSAGTAEAVPPEVKNQTESRSTQSFVHEPTVHKLRHLVLWIALICGVYAIGSLVAWILIPHILRESEIQDTLVYPRGALLLTLGAFSLASLSFRTQSKVADFIGRALGVVVVILTCVFFAFQLGVSPPEVPGFLKIFMHQFEVYRYAPVGVIIGLLLGSSLVLLDRRIGKQLISGWLGLAALFLALVGCFFYIDNISLISFTGAPRVFSSTPRIIAVLLLGLGVLFLRTDHPMIATITRNSAGGALCRTLLPAAIGLPLILGLIRGLGQYLGWFGQDVGNALFVPLTVAVLAAVIWKTSKSLDVVDFERIKTTQTLRETEQQALDEMTRANEELTILTEQLQETRDAALDYARAKSDFLAYMSHEIRTPMTAIITANELLRTMLHPEQVELWSVINAAGQTLVDTIDDILSYSKLDVGKLQLEEVEFDIRQVIGKAMNLFHLTVAQKKLKVHVEISTLVPARVVGDPARLRQILINVIGNAVKFTEEGQIFVRVSLPATRWKDHIRFTVGDTGPGMDRETISRLFSPFTQADNSITRLYGGSGLGLSICKGLLELMNGTIKVRSKKGVGSVFSFLIPLTGTAASTARPEVQKSHTSTESRHASVLVVDDNPVNRKLLEMQLKQFGCDVHAATSGREAIAAVTHERFSLVFMDCFMPDVDGFTATAEIRKVEDAIGKHTPIIALTAQAMPGDRERCLEAGMDDYLSKPTSLDALRHTINRWAA